MPGKGASVNASYVGLAARAGAILLGLLTLLASAYVHYRSALDAAAPGATVASPRLIPIVLPALLLLVIAALAVLPLPAPVPRAMQPLVETLGAAIVIGAVPGGQAFMPYLLAPVVTAGLTAALWASIACATSAWVVILSITAAQGTTAALGNQLQQAAIWLPTLVTAGWIAAWVRRLRDERMPLGEPAYADAHRLLSELHVVARQLSLGLDPQTLAAALLDDVTAIVPQARATVLIRSGGGRFVPLVGTEPPEAGASAMQDAWVGADPVRRYTAGVHVAALPVRMGERVVALVVLTSDHALSDGTITRCRAVIGQAGARMASAMLFDDVRRLATVDERMRVAREIHDGIAQDLASVGYLLDDIHRDVDDGVGHRVVEVREQLRTMVSDLRLSIFDLRTGVDDSVGLATALGEYAQRVGSQSGLAVHVSMEESPTRLPSATEVELLRMVQEAVTNVRKHAGARNLWVTLAVDPPSARITVADDGRGLQRGRPDSMGLTGMRERARRIGAELSIGDRPEGGTLVEITLPAGQAHAPARLAGVAAQPPLPADAPAENARPMAARADQEAV